MRQNIQRTEQRGSNLNEMEHKTDRMGEAAKQFNRGANRMHKNLKWKNVRMWVYIILGIAVAALIIGLGMLRHPSGLNSKRNALNPFYSRAFWQMKSHGLSGVSYQQYSAWTFPSMDKNRRCKYGVDGRSYL